MPTCIVMVGLPGLGKSTVIDKLSIRKDAWVYSTDMYIDAVAEDHGISYSEAFETNIKAATAFNEQKLKTMMNLGKDIIWDQTNLGVGKRKKIINRMRQAGYTVECIYIKAPDVGHFSDQTEWDFRLKNREGKVIPQHVLANMIESLVEPTIEEGFDMVSVFNMYGVLLGVVHSISA